MDNNNGECSACACAFDLPTVSSSNSVKVTEYIAYNLLSNYGSNAEVKAFLDKYDFYVFPVVNPDGTKDVVGV